MTADQILKKYEDENEHHFHPLDRGWIIDAMEEYAGATNDANRLLPAVNIDLMNEILQRNFERFRQSLEEYSQHQLKEFCDHLNTYKGLEECRFDFMLVDFNGR
jgi:hypothetical protein